MSGEHLETRNFQAEMGLNSTNLWWMSQGKCWRVEVGMESNTLKLKKTRKKKSTKEMQVSSF